MVGLAFCAASMTCLEGRIGSIVYSLGKGINWGMVFVEIIGGFLLNVDCVRWFRLRCTRV